MKYFLYVASDEVSKAELVELDGCRHFEAVYQAHLDMKGIVLQQSYEDIITHFNGTKFQMLVIDIQPITDQLATAAVVSATNYLKHHN